MWSPKIISNLTIVNNIDSFVTCKIEAASYHVEKFTIFSDTINTPDPPTFSEKINNVFLTNQVLKISCYHHTTNINIKRPKLSASIQEVTYRIRSDNVLLKVKYQQNKMNEAYYDVTIKMRPFQQSECYYVTSRQSSIPDVSVMSSKPKSPNRSRRYSSKFVPINQEQAAYLEAKLTRTSRSSVTSANGIDLQMV